MPRPERRLDPTDGPLQQFAVELRQLRRAAGEVAYRELSRRAHFAASVLSEAAGGRKLPSLAVTLAYARACGGDPREWEARWRSVAAEVLGSQHDGEPEHLTVPSGSTAPGEAETVRPCPYLGVASFQPEDAQWFVGRERLVEKLVSQLAERRCVGVFGSSGSGKSSLLRAGLLPQLGRMTQLGGQYWSTVLLTPGAHPVGELAIHLAAARGVARGSVYSDLLADPRSLGLAVCQALADKPEHAELLLVVDQFEEVFTLCQDAAERMRFIAALMAVANDPSSRARLVLGVRSDFRGRCEEYPDLVRALGDGQVLVGRMMTRELRRAISEPAVRTGLRVERALVTTILADAGNEPGALPLVSQALLETWRRCRGNRLTLSAYDAVGGIHGVITQDAERVYSDLRSDQQRLARRMFLRLVAVGEGMDDARRRVARAEIESCPDSSATAALLERLAAARLVTLHQDTVEIAHEALIRSWPRLRQWLAKDREGLRIHRQLIETARVWESLDRDPGSLYRGARLAVTWEWADCDDHRDQLSTLERTFLEASSALQVREHATTGRRGSYLRWLIAGLAILIIVAGGAWTARARACLEARYSSAVWALLGTHGAAGAAGRAAR